MFKFWILIKLDVLYLFSILFLSIIPAHAQQRRRDGTVVRALACHQCCPGDCPDSIPVRCHMWVEFVVGSHFAPRVFLGFSSLHKDQHIKIPIRSLSISSMDDLHENLKADVASFLNVITLLFLSSC